MVRHAAVSRRSITLRTTILTGFAIGIILAIVSNLILL